MNQLATATIGLGPDRRAAGRLRGAGLRAAGLRAAGLRAAGFRVDGREAGLRAAGFAPDGRDVRWRVGEEVAMLATLKDKSSVARD